MYTCIVIQKETCARAGVIEFPRSIIWLNILSVTCEEPSLIAAALVISFTSPSVRMCVYIIVEPRTYT